MGVIGERAAVIRLLRRSRFDAGPGAVAAGVAGGFTDPAFTDAGSVLVRQPVE